jgi:predicted ATP-dependent Lon-type protease
MSIGETINKVEELASTLQVCFDAGAKRISEALNIQLTDFNLTVEILFLYDCFGGWPISS